MKLQTKFTWNVHNNVNARKWIIFVCS